MCRNGDARGNVRKAKKGVKIVENLSPALWSGVGATTVYVAAELASILSNGKLPDAWSLVLFAYIGFAAIALALISTFLGWILEIKFRLPTSKALRLIWGGVLGAATCTILDGPNYDPNRWLPYAVAAAAGVSASFAFNYSKGYPIDSIVECQKA